MKIYYQRWIKKLVGESSDKKGVDKHKGNDARVTQMIGIGMLLLVALLFFITVMKLIEITMEIPK